MFQQALLNRIKRRLPPNTSLIECIASTLDISYDAAHRRTSLKSKFSLREALLLSKRYHLSLDGLLDLSGRNTVAVERTDAITNEKELEAYFIRSARSLSALKSQPDNEILYSAKDVPLFYLLKGDLITRFKIYVWLKLLDPNFRNEKFESFYPKLAVVEAAKTLSAVYEHLKPIEIWDITTINSTLKQIHFYWQAGLLSSTTAIELCVQLNKLIKTLSRRITSKGDHLKLYYNELLLMNNQVLVRTANQQSLYVPFSMLSYYLTQDETTCDQAREYFEKQLDHSKLLNSAGEKERNTFFHKMYEKIGALSSLIEARVLLDFE